MDSFEHAMLSSTKRLASGIKKAVRRFYQFKKSYRIVEKVLVKSGK